MTRTEYLRIGLIVRPHGVRGALKLESTTFDITRFKSLSDAFIESNGTYTPVKVLSSSYSGKEAYVTLEGVDSREKAESLRGHFLCVDRAHAAKLPEGQYFVVDIIGCAVYDTDNNYIGELVDVTEHPASDVYEIKTESGKIYVPALKKLLVNVDIENKRIVVDKTVLSEVGLFE